MDAFEFDRAEGVDEKPEHASSSDSGKLQWVADQRDSPSPLVCEPSERSEFRGGQHPGLVDDHCYARWQVEPCAGSSAEVVLDQEFVECVRRDPGLLGQHFGRGGGGCHPKQHPALGLNLGDCWRQRGFLPGAGRADDQHDVGVACDCACGGGLGDVQFLRTPPMTESGLSVLSRVRRRSTQSIRACS